MNSPSSINFFPGDAQEQQEEVAVQLRLPKPSDEGPATAEARRWVLETRFDALSTEIKMLDQELLSQPIRLDLLKAERDRAAAKACWRPPLMRMTSTCAGSANWNPTSGGCWT